MATAAAENVRVYSRSTTRANWSIHAPWQAKSCATPYPRPGAPAPPDNARNTQWHNVKSFSAPRPCPTTSRPAFMRLASGSRGRTAATFQSRPVYGDQLIADGGTLNIKGGNLYGDILLIGEDVPLKPVILNISDGAAVPIDVISLTNNVTANVSGTDTVDIFSTPTSGGPSYNQANSIINLAAHAKVISTDNLQFGSLVVNGDDHTTFRAEGDLTFAGTAVTLNTSVAGNGTLAVSAMPLPPALAPYGLSGVVNGSLRIDGSVAHGVDVVLNSTVGESSLTVTDPKDFAGMVSLGTNSFIDLLGVNADSYSIRADMLTLYAGHKPVDTLQLTNTTKQPYTIEQNASGVHIASSGMDTSQIGGVGHLLAPVPA